MRGGGGGIKLGADPGCHRHLGQRDQEAAIRNVVDGGDGTLADQQTNQIAVAALARKVDRRWGALLALADFAQIERLSEPSCGLADEQDRFVGGLESERCGLGEILEQPHAAD